MKCKKCKEKAVQTFDRGFPAFSCEACGFLDNQWIKLKEDYLHRWKRDELWDKNNEKTACILGYFCHIYEKQYDRPLSLSITNPNPFHCNDWHQAQKLLSTFSGDARSAKQYMDWYFEYEIPNKKRRITSLGGLNVQWLINNYMQEQDRKKKIGRTSALPGEFIDWCKRSADKIFKIQKLNTYEDLNFLISYCETSDDLAFDDVEMEIVNEAIRRDIAPPTGLIKFEE